MCVEKLFAAYENIINKQLLILKMQGKKVLQSIGKKVFSGEFHTNSEQTWLIKSNEWKVRRS